MRQTISTGLRLALAATLGLMAVALTSDAEAQILGTAENFGVLAGSTVTNTGPTTITGGDLGVSPGTAITGFFGTVEDDGPGRVIGGTIHQNDAVAVQAQVDLTDAYEDLMSRPFDVDLTGQDLGGKILIPGVYSFGSSSAQLTGTVTLDGLDNPNSLFIFQIGSTLTTASNSAVVLINGANPNNVYWVVGSSATIGTGTQFAGNIVALTSITLNTGASITCGRALARNGAVTLDNNAITVCLPDNGGGDDGDDGDGDDGDDGVDGGGGGGVGVDDDDDIPIDELFGEGVSGTQETAFDASRLFGAAMMAQAVYWRGGGFPYGPGGAPGSGPGAPGSGPGAPGAPPQGPEKYRPLKVGPSDEPAAFVDTYQPRAWRTWAAGLGGTTSLEGDDFASDLDVQTGGVAVGLDYQVNRTTLIGIAGGYTSSDLSVDQLQTDGELEGTHVGLYGVKGFGSLYVAATAEYAHFNNHTDRFIDFIVQERARGSFDSDEYGARIEAGWTRSFGRYNVTPFGGLEVYHLESDGFAEDSRGSTGAPGFLGLAFESEEVTSLVSSLGLQLDTWIPLRNGRYLTPFVRVAWLHEFNPERTMDASLLISPAAAFTVLGASAAEDAARVTAGLKLDITQRIALFGFFEGEFSDRGQSYAGLGGGDVEFYGAGRGLNYNGRVAMKVAW